MTLRPQVYARPTHGGIAWLSSAPQLKCDPLARMSAGTMVRCARVQPPSLAPLTGGSGGSRGHRSPAQRTQPFQPQPSVARPCDLPCCPPAPQAAHQALVARCKAGLEPVAVDVARPLLRHLAPHGRDGALSWTLVDCAEADRRPRSAQGEAMDEVDGVGWRGRSILLCHIAACTYVTQITQEPHNAWAMRGGRARGRGVSGGNAGTGAGAGAHALPLGTMCCLGWLGQARAGNSARWAVLLGSGARMLPCQNWSCTQCVLQRM